MNDQFFTLALKAMDFQGAIDSDTELVMTNSELQKFAELIVQECAAVIASNAKKFPPTDLTWIAAMEESARVVKEHFEVD